LGDLRLVEPSCDLENIGGGQAVLLGRTISRPGDLVSMIESPYVAHTTTGSPG
jgi:hypothetical protein